MSPAFIFLIGAGLSAVLAIACERRGARHPAFYVLKPLTTLLLLGAALSAPQADAQYRLWIAAGLALSALGDASLMFEGNAAFLAGLGSFLMAHLLFVTAFVLPLANLTPPLWSLIFVVGAGAFFIWLLPRTGDLKLPVLIYGSTLVAMAVLAATRWQARGDDSGLLALAGAVVFIVSDSALAVRQFVGPYRMDQALILGTYWPAVGLIACSVIASAMI
jgi:uncharacterized membrane protein YhhN